MRLKDTLSLLRTHPRSRVLSEYLDGELRVLRQRRLEAHLRACLRCRELLGSLKATVELLGASREVDAAGVTDRLILSFRGRTDAEPFRAQSPRAVVPALRLVSEGGVVRQRMTVRASLRAAVSSSVRRARLRVTVPIAIVVGITLSLANQGSMILSGHVDVAMCAACGLNFLIPFIALNALLLPTVWLRARGARRPPMRRERG
jgi:anti-sigma factor RsiW